MLKPPFKLATTTPAASLVAASVFTPDAPAHAAAGCCEEPLAQQATAPHTRIRLADLDPHLHCSVIGTCLGTAELRKLMARFLFVRDASDLEVHHEAVRLAGQGGPVVKALHKALEQRHEHAVQRFSRAADAAALAALWDEAQRHGEIPGAYWAVLTHRHATADVRQKAFGDVHMLSHLLGSSHRADLRRLAALEAENLAWRERSERQQWRAKALMDERDHTIAQLQQVLDSAQAQQQLAVAAAAAPPADGDVRADTLQRIALQTHRRERAEQSAGLALHEAARLREELAHAHRHAQALHRELTAAETQLREMGGDPSATNRSLARQLAGRRVFYVGGRPSSTPAIRHLVVRHGGEFQHHDGGLEDRKGLLASGVAWATLVVFPVDCVDHDSAGNLKKMCSRQGVAYLPLRGASVASFAAALASDAADEGDGDPPPGAPGCVKHG